MTGPGAILSALNAAVLTVDRAGAVTSFNPAAEGLLNIGAPQALGQPLSRILPEDHPLFGMIDVVREQGVNLTEYEVAIETPRVKLPVVLAQLSPVGDGPDSVAVMLVPMTLAREIDRHLAHRGAARSVGGMAAVLAHEIKNPLAGIRGAAQLIEANVDAGDRELAALIRDEADRVAALVNRMEAFAGPDGLERKPVNIHEVLNRVRKVSQTGFASGIAFVEEYDPSLPPVPGDHDRLVQVFLNLVKNAADACPGEGGEKRARMVAFDITSTIEQKMNSIELLRNRNQVYARTVRDRLVAAGRTAEMLNPLDDMAVRKLVRSYVEQLGATIGAKHGFRFGEEFNHAGRNPGLPPHVLEKAVPK